MKLTFALAGVMTTLLVKADFYANFFDGKAGWSPRLPSSDSDEDAGENCDGEQGMGVYMLDQGCLWQPGRRSVYIPKTWNPSRNFCLVMTDGPKENQCRCQKNSCGFTPTGEVRTGRIRRLMGLADWLEPGWCMKLNPEYTSYRFIEVRTTHGLMR